MNYVAFQTRNAYCSTTAQICFNNSGICLMAKILIWLKFVRRSKVLTCLYSTLFLPSLPLRSQQFNSKGFYIDLLENYSVCAYVSVMSFIQFLSSWWKFITYAKRATRRRRISTLRVGRTFNDKWRGKVVAFFSLLSFFAPIDITKGIMAKKYEYRQKSITIEKSFMAPTKGGEKAARDLMGEKFGSIC